MSDSQKIKPAQPEDTDEEEPAKGLNLFLIYSLIALALIAAIGFALMIVAPFYHRQ